MFEYKCIIKNIVDGDTVDVDIDLGFYTWVHDKRIRLYGIDTPETRTRDLVEKQFGLYAKDYVANLLPIGSKQILKTVKDGSGKFGRILGSFQILDPGTGERYDLNKRMIEDHVAVEYGDKEKMLENHLKNRQILIETDKVMQ